MEELFEAGVGDEDPFDDHRNILYPSSIEGLTEEQKLEGSEPFKITRHSRGRAGGGGKGRY
jgi:hypothetical protein